MSPHWSPLARPHWVSGKADTYSYVFLNGEVFHGEVAELHVSVMGDLQVTERLTQLSALLAQLSVGLLELLLPELDGLHLLLTQSLLLPGEDQSIRF